jgi:hypothetical protein
MVLEFDKSINFPNTERIAVEKPEERRPLGRTRHRWQNNFTINIKVIL